MGAARRHNAKAGSEFMLIIAERINATRKRIGQAFAARDAAFIQAEA
ncbi:unnamed protein product, partial [marine sediment metagenome]